jgi:hypothetical protein
MPPCEWEAPRLCMGLSSLAHASHPQAARIRMEIVNFMNFTSGAGPAPTPAHSRSPAPTGVTLL